VTATVPEREVVVARRDPEFAGYQLAWLAEQKEQPSPFEKIRKLLDSLA
jgi:hypothetical protein